MNYLGDFAVGQEVYVWFNTFDSNDPSASVTMTTFIDTDVHIHKDDSLVQRNNAAGVEVDIDVDGIAGVHKITIHTDDNTVADFYEAGHDYAVRIEGATVDAALINPVVGTFSIANRRVAGEMCRSSIESLASQTSFTLTTGEASAQDDAYNFCTIIVTDQTTRIQKAIGFISDYTGATRTVTLIAAPLASGFTMAIGDSVEILATSAFANAIAWNSIPLATTNPLPNAAPDAAGGLPVSDLGGLDLDTQLAATNEVTAARMGALTDWIDGGRLDLLLDAVATTADLLDKVGAVSEAAATGDPSATESLMQYAKQTVNILIGSDGIAAFPAESAPGNAVSLAEVLRAIHTDVTGLNGDVMRGTDSAATAANLALTDGKIDDIQGATFATGTDSLEAIRNRGDAAWSAAGSSPQLLQNTTIAVLTSQTRFTLTAGSTDDDAYNNALIIITDGATSTQKAFGEVRDYIGATRTVLLKLNPGVFTMAAGDTVDIVAVAKKAADGYET